MPDSFVAASWLADVKSWTGTFLRRHSFIRLSDSDKMELKARLPTWSEALQLGKRSTVALEIQGGFELSGDSNTGKYTGTLNGTIRERNQPTENFEAKASFEFWRADRYGAMYHLAIEGGPGGVRDEPPDLNVAYRNKLTSGLVDWVFSLGTDQGPVLFPMVVSIPSAICRSVDLSALHRNYWDVPDPKKFGMGIIHRHQQQWCLKPVDIAVIEPASQRDGLYQPTDSHPAEICYSEQLPPPPKGGKGAAEPSTAVTKKLRASSLLTARGTFREDEASDLETTESASVDSDKEETVESVFEPIVPDAYYLIEEAEVFHFVDECPALAAAIAPQVTQNRSHKDLVDLAYELPQRLCGTCMRMVGLGGSSLLAIAQGKAARIGVFNTHIDLYYPPGFFSAPQQFIVPIQDVERVVIEPGSIWGGKPRLRLAFAEDSEERVFEAANLEEFENVEKALRSVGLKMEA